jgi:hypothetical protein
VIVRIITYERRTLVNNEKYIGLDGRRIAIWVFTGEDMRKSLGWSLAALRATIGV